MAHPTDIPTTTKSDLKSRGIELWTSNWRLWVLIIVHVVGVIGLCQAPPISNLFLKLTPVNLMLTLYLFMSADPVIFSKRGASSLLLIGFLGYLIEVVGVHTGLIFGNYWYGPSLGIKVVQVPLLIGVNWVILVFAMSYWLSSWGLSNILRAVIGAVLLTAFDWVMEPVAVHLDFWQWENDIIPVRNYIGWFGTSFALLLLSGHLEPKQHNKLAVSVLLIQLLFFVILRLLLVV